MTYVGHRTSSLISLKKVKVVVHIVFARNVVKISQFCSGSYSESVTSK